MSIDTVQLMLPRKLPLVNPFGRWVLFLIFAFFTFGIGLLLIPFIFRFLNGGSLKRLCSDMQKESQAVMEKFVGGKAQYIDAAHSFRQSDRTFSGTAIAYANKVFYIIDHGLGTKFSLDDIRSWEWKIAGASYGSSIAIGNPMHLMMQAQAAQRQAQRTELVALIDSGFFITVADINKPVWQFMNSDKNVLNKWMEIFEQAQEGKI